MQVVKPTKPPLGIQEGNSKSGLPGRKGSLGNNLPSNIPPANHQQG